MVHSQWIGKCIVCIERSVTEISTRGERAGSPGIRFDEGDDFRGTLLSGSVSPPFTVSLSIQKRLVSLSLSGIMDIKSLRERSPVGAGVSAISIGVYLPWLKTNPSLPPDAQEPQILLPGLYQQIR